MHSGFGIIEHENNLVRSHTYWPVGQLCSSVELVTLPRHVSYVTHLHKSYRINLKKNPYTYYISDFFNLIMDHVKSHELKICYRTGNAMRTKKQHI